MEIRGERPLARSTDLIIEELGEELLVYDTNVDRAHSLSPEAAKIWRSCDGTTSAQELSIKLGLDADTVARALDELSGCDLLDEPPTLAPVPEGSTRREATLRMAKVGAAVAAAPLIVSVAAPTPAMAATLAQCLALTASNNCGQQPGGCGSVEGCCCCVPPVQATVPVSGGFAFPPPAATCNKFFAPATKNQQCKTCVPCDGDAAFCAANHEPGAQCSDGDCPDTAP